jgi:hypothetical protein
MSNCHYWGDKDFDWEALNEAERIVRRITKLFRIGVHTKEKYGTLRCSVYLFDGSPHSITHPGYVYNQYPVWLWRISCNMSYWGSRRPYSWLVSAIRGLQLNVGYRLAFYVAMKKYPHIAEEICVNVDYHEYIIGGKEIHDKYWETVK